MIFSFTGRGNTRAFSLVEVTLALGVAAFCLLALFGLLPIGVSSNQAAIEQTAAASVASGVVADLRGVSLVAVPPGAPTPTPPSTRQYGISVPPTSSASIYTLFVKDYGSMAQKSSATPKGAGTGWDIDLTQSPQYRVTLVFNPPTSSQLSVTPVRVLVTWPAAADPKASTSLNDLPSRFSGSFETVTALVRN